MELEHPAGIVPSPEPKCCSNCDIHLNGDNGAIRLSYSRNKPLQFNAMCPWCAWVVRRYADLFECVRAWLWRTIGTKMYGFQNYE